MQKTSQMHKQHTLYPCNSRLVLISYPFNSRFLVPIPWSMHVWCTSYLSSFLLTYVTDCIDDKPNKDNNPSYPITHYPLPITHYPLPIPSILISFDMHHFGRYWDATTRPRTLSWEASFDHNWYIAALLLWSISNTIWSYKSEFWKGQTF